MGICIHYKGQLNNINFINSFIDELTAIANEMEWDTTLINEDLNAENAYIGEPGHIKNSVPVKGIVLEIHPKAENLSFVFDKNGYMRDFRSLVIDKNEPVCSIKTQFAPIDIHITVIKLLKYLKKKYINNLQVFDEGSYWETNDKILLAQKLDFLTMKLDELEGILNEIVFDGKDTVDSVAEKIDRVLKERNSSLHAKKIKGKNKFSGRE